MDDSLIETNLAAIRGKIAAAAAESGRTPDEITLLAAVKYTDTDGINALTRLGIRDIGENRVQQLLEHWDKLEGRERLRIHMIGSLQTNKVKYIIDKVCMIHSLDSGRLAAEIERQAARCGLTMDVLVEINSGREDSKGGVLPEEVADFCETLGAYPHINLRGFMTMAPRCEDRAAYLRYFGDTAALCRDVWQNRLHRNDAPILSMGMSGSYEEAILCGATIVRVGRGFFADPNASV